MQGVELDDFVSGPRELLLKLVEEHYPLPQDPKIVEGLYQFFASDKFLFLVAIKLLYSPLCYLCYL